MNSFKLRVQGDSPYRRLIGVGGIGAGILLALEGDHDLGRNESRAARLVDARDYCKLHIITHYLAALLDRSEAPFDVIPIGKVGADSAGNRLLQEMIDVGVDPTYVDTVVGQPTLFSVCYQYPDGTGGNITTSESAASLLTTEDVDRLNSLFEDSRNGTIALSVPEAPLHVRHHLLKMATNYDAFRVASFTSAEVLEAQQLNTLNFVDLLVLNLEEAAKLVGQKFDATAPHLFLEQCAMALRASQPQMNIVISTGKDGAFGFSNGEWSHSPGLPVEVVSTAGAGDALLSGILAAMIAGIPFTNKGESGNSPAVLKSALDFGVLLASYSVTSPHTIHPETNLGAVLDFAEDLGIKFGEELGNLVAGD